jgi:DNA-binding MarR family transcriptional regulator
MARVSNRKRELLEAVILALREYQTATEMLDECAFARLGVNSTDGRCLDVLERDGPVSAGRLAEACGLSSGAVTTAIDRLEHAGLARRTRDPADRRRVLVEMTAEGSRACSSVYGPLGEEGSGLLAGYTVEQLTLIHGFLERGRALNERHARRISEGGAARPDRG